MTARRWDIAFGLALAVLFAWAALESRRWSELARTFPMAVAVFGLVLALLALVLPARKADAPEPDELSDDVRRRRTAAAVGWIAAFFLAVWALGFLVAIPLATVAYLRACGERWPVTAAIAAASWAFVYGLFDRVLHVPLPPGELLRAAGLG
ncbi:MAG TPA: tripartite tricarboxylate transporter TctB family protein [Candidatus Limnocylindria bacterium]|nr:tripartite tricarboxylate transporter TctB family protein [Candidatus Limnocylindria bacterium]